MKYNRPWRASSYRATARKSRRLGGRRWGRKRGVSEVVATIILLAMTVVLFASIFAWVTSFPTPAPQSVTQFSANFVVTSNGTYVQALQITHLAGPAVTGGTQLYLKSAYFPKEVAMTNSPYTVSSYLPNPNSWNLGQTLTLPFSTSPFQLPKLPDNITILIVNNGQLIFSTILPGMPIAVPPTFVEAAVAPATPSVAASFTITAVDSGNTGGATVYVGLANLPGLSAHYPSPVPMTYSASTNQWSFTVPAGYTNANGTYYAFVNVTNSVGQQATAGIAVTLISSGGSGTSKTLSVAVVMTPQPPTLPGTSAYFAAVVTYLGSGTNLGLSVSFFVNQTPGSPPKMPTPWATQSTSLTGPSGLTISGGSTVTVYSSTPATFANWLLNSTALVTAVGSVATAGSASGSTSFSTANLVQGLVQPIPSAGFSHTCVTGSPGTLCPFLNVTVWDNWTTAITFKAYVTVNTSGGTVNRQSYTIGSTAVASGGSTSISAAGAKLRWKPTAAYGSTLISAWITVYNGATLVGVIYDTFTVNIT